MAKEILYRCNFCEAPFATESRFLKHKCKQMLREEQFASLAGQAAWNYYKTWMKLKHRSVVSNSSTFKKSKYFKTFYNFTSFVKKAHLPNIDIFIDLMVRKSIDPNYWTNDVAYRKYLEHISRKLSMPELVKITVKTLFDIADAADVSVNNVFDVLTPNEVIQLLHQRRLSPCILLNSKKFANFYINGTTAEEKIMMQSIVNANYWTNRFNKNPKDLQDVKLYITELGL